MIENKKIFSLQNFYYFVQFFNSNIYLLYYSIILLYK